MNAKETFLQCGFVDQKLYCDNSGPNLVNKKNNQINNKCKDIFEATDEIIESGKKIITIKKHDGGDQTVQVFDSVTCKENKIPDFKKYNVKFIGVSNDVMVFHYGYGGNWAGVMQYDLNKKLPPVKIENTTGDERTTSFSPNGLLVTDTVDDFHYFYLLSDKNFKQSSCLKSEGAGFEPESTVLSENGKYMAVSFFKNDEEKRYLAIYELLN